VVNYEETARLYHNDNDTGNHYLIVELEGTISNRDGIGSRLRIRTPDGEVQHSETHSGTSLGGGDDLATYFGLGKNSVVSELLIRWPSGHVQTVLDITADRRIRVLEDTSARVTRLVYFDAFAEGYGVTVRWQTAFEASNAGFDVQLKNGQTFETIGFVKSKGKMFESVEYEYRAARLRNGVHVFRLKQSDTTGSFEYSPEVTVKYVSPDRFQLSGAHPNPFYPNTEFTLSVGQDQIVRVEVFDVAGRRVSTVHDGPFRSIDPRPFTFDGSGLPSGVYFIRAEGETSVSVVKVMLLR
jgi:hypothetical protein